MERRKVLVLLGLAMLLAWAGGLGQTLWKETFEGLTPPAYDLGLLNWKLDPNPATDPSNLWRGVDIAQLWGEGLPAFPSGTKAAYFGKVDSATGKGTYDDGRVGGSLLSPPITIDFSKAIKPQQIASNLLAIPNDYKAFVAIRFWSLREVEYFASGEYDVTQVMVNSKEIWRKSSKNVSQRVWEEVVSDPVLVQQKGPISVTFNFDSVDQFANNYLGWLIDDVEVRIAPLTFKTEFLPSAKIGETYTVSFRAVGGAPKKQDNDYGVTARVVSGQLPPRFQLPSFWKLDGGEYSADVPWKPTEPETQVGEYTFTIEIEDALGQKAQRTFTLVVTPAEQVGVIFKEENFASGWEMTGLWHIATDIPQTPSVEAPSAAYNKGVYPNCDYDTGNRTYGYLTSPEIDVSRYPGSMLRVQFIHWREVESYETYKYDLTFVEVSFDGSQWKRIWEKSSADGSNDWITETAEVEIPLAANKVRIRFGFDSVDGQNNKYKGWFLDNVQLSIATNKLEIIRQRLPEAEAGVPYYYKFSARGGIPPYEWEADSRLPKGLQLDRATGVLWGTPAPELKGDFPFTVTVKDSSNPQQKVSQDFTLTVREKTTIFSDGFEDGLGNWEGENLGLWHVTKAPPKPNVDLSGRGNVAYYGKDETGNYNTGARTYGYLTSNPFALDGASFFQVTFDYWREVEFYGAGGYDQTYVQVRFLIGTSWSTWYTVWSRDCATPSTPSEKAWTTATSGPYSVPSGAIKMQIRFVFDSVDRFYNNYVGWLIDNVKVAKATSGSPLPTSSLTLTAARGEITFQNIPNPVRDVHTTTFVVRGVEAERIRVEVYDLAGKLVWKGEALGNELTWHTEDLTGLPLANGVYLYKVYVKVGEAWIVSDVKKLVILR